MRSACRFSRVSSTSEIMCLTTTRIALLAALACAAAAATAHAFPNNCNLTGYCKSDDGTRGPMPLPPPAPHDR
jgi:hypothetical protein